jgi:tetratricopeptide (TPR) repeat protein
MNSDNHGTCRDIQVWVQDSAGIAIMGADVVSDSSFMGATTDSRGIARIPCGSIDSSLFMSLEVSALGYQTARVPLISDGSSPVRVRLEKREPVARGQERTISARELSPSIQAESQELQNQAEKALARKDYSTAEDLLLKAHELTPSAVSVLNNLGVVALHKNDLDAAASWFEKAAHAAPFKPDIIGNLGLVRWLQHRNDESYTLLVKAASMGYATSLGHYILGTVGLGKGMNKEAAENLKKISSDRYPYRDLYLSIALRNAGKTRAADESYRNFIKRNPVPYAISILPKVSG